MELITVTDLAGNSEPLLGFKGLTRRRAINGEKILSFSIFSCEENKFSFDLVKEESSIEFDGEIYIIKSLKERNVGRTFFKQVECIHEFFVKLTNKQKYETHSGSMTFQTALDFIFEGTGYQTAVIDSFYAESFDNFGKDNRLSLLKKALDRYKAEMSISRNFVKFRKRIGEDTDFQFRYNFNIKTFERDVDTKPLRTYIKGFGKDGLVREYTSPNVEKFGFSEAPMIEDDRFTTTEGLDAALKESLQDVPVVSIQIDFIDLRKAGYPYIVPNEGDRVFLIYEPMGIDIETRILEIVEEYDSNLNPISTKVTLSNRKEDFAGTFFSQIDKSMSQIVNDDGKVKYNVLDEAVKLATEAVKSAQTELKFENGILAINPENPNEIVVFNSAGIGISRDGGQTFQEALTYKGLVASVGVIGFLSANNIRGGEMMAANGKFRINLDESAIEFFTFDNERKISSISQARAGDGAEITYFVVERNENSKAAISIGIRNQDGSVGNNIYVDGKSGDVAINAPDFEVHSHTKNYGAVDFAQQVNFVGASYINTKLPGGSWEIENIGGYQGGPIFAPKESGKGSIGNEIWRWGEGFFNEIHASTLNGTNITDLFNKIIELENRLKTLENKAV